ncbi:hypothetical protein M0802_010653 [Mischocyttarus mexicanus]|nr:hypothetical protein M0802_010653 [Mischocyttarus mexicanus]
MWRLIIERPARDDWWILSCSALNFAQVDFRRLRVSSVARSIDEKSFTSKRILVMTVARVSCRAIFMAMMTSEISHNWSLLRDYLSSGSKDQKNVRK